MGNDAAANGLKLGGEVIKVFFAKHSHLFHIGICAMVCRIGIRLMFGIQSFNYHIHFSISPLRRFIQNEFTLIVSKIKFNETHYKFFNNRAKCHQNIMRLPNLTQNAQSSYYLAYKFW